MKNKEALQILQDYQLLEKNGEKYDSVYEIRERYERFRGSTNKRVRDVLEACDMIESNLVKEVEDSAKHYAQFEGDSKFDKDSLKFIIERDKENIANVGKKLPLNSWNKEQNQYLNEIYSKHKARTHKQKRKALQKIMGGGSVHFSGMWREPSWKIRQFDVRALEYILLLDNGFNP